MAAVMLGSAALFALGHGLTAILVLLVGGALASFLGVLTTGRLSRRRRERWQQQRGDQPFVLPDE